MGSERRRDQENDVSGSFKPPKLAFSHPNRFGFPKQSVIDGVFGIVEDPLRILKKGSSSGF